jgi:cytochrome c oxidase subunit 1
MRRGSGDARQLLYSGGAAQAGWTSYSPLATTVATDGQTFWLVGMVLLITSSSAGAVNFIATIIQLRAPGMTWMRMPFFCLGAVRHRVPAAAGVSAAGSRGVMQLMDKVMGTSCFFPAGLAVTAHDIPAVAARSCGSTCSGSWASGGLRADPAGHGDRAESHRQQHAQAVVGLQSLVYSGSGHRFLSFIVWAHHMYLTGHGHEDQHVLPNHHDDHLDPSVIILTCLFISLWGGSIRFNVPMLFSLAFLVMFGIGGLTGLPLGMNSATCTCTTPITSSPTSTMWWRRDDLRPVRRHLLLVPEVTGA